MKFHARFTLLSLLAGAVIALFAPAAAQASFGVESHGFFAASCSEKFETCAKEAIAKNEEATKAEAEEQGFSQAAGHPNWGVTDFKVTSPEDPIVHIRTDVAPGFSTNPTAVAQCSPEEFGTTEVGKGVFPPPTCNPSTILGKDEVTVFIGFPLTLTGTVYNLTPAAGRSSTFGVAFELPTFLTGGIPGLFAHTLIEGNVEWGKEANGTGQADYHDYFEINVNPELPLLRSRLVFKGNIGTGGFLTNGSNCEGPGRVTTSKIQLKSLSGAVAEKTYTTPIGLSGCNLVPFNPTFSLSPETSQSDANDGITAKATLPHDPNPANLDDSQLKTAVVTLPEGMTLNPSAAAGLKTCTSFVIKGVHAVGPGEFECPAAAKLGTLTLNVPGLPPGALTGNIYLGGSEPITGPPYIVYLDAESKQYGLSVHLKGETVTNPATGQVVTTFSENPEQPFSEAILHFNGGSLAPIANPLSCGAATATTLLTPFAQGVSAKAPASAFNVSGCSSPVAFAPAQSTVDQTAVAGAKTSFAFNLERPEGQQYLKHVTTTLPAGLIGLIPTVEQCPEPQANAGTCPAGSLIGSVRAFAGSGPTPFEFNGKVYFTGPYNGAPFGMSIVVPQVAGPFNFGNLVTRAAVGVDPHTARVVVSSELPLISSKGGVPIRLRRLIVTVNRQGFLENPTNCGPLATESVLTGVFGTNALASSPFAVEKCTSLAFKPSFKAKTSSRSTKANGTSIETTLNLPLGGSNVKSVLVTLPVQLPSRLTTLQKACPEATFAANPLSCPSGSFVGGVRANTPALKDKMKGPAILVSHGGAAFPDLDLLLEADGVRVILVGNTDIKKGITTTNFAATPDAPVSSITVNLPAGPHSAVTGFGDLCKNPLYMPAVITGQNGTVFKQKTKMTVAECGVRVVGHKVIRNTAYITVKTFAAGRISGKGSGLATVFRRLRGATGAATLKVPLSRGGRGRHRPFKVRLRVGFLPSNRKLSPSAAFVTVRFP